MNFVMNLFWKKKNCPIVFSDTMRETVFSHCWVFGFFYGRLDWITLGSMDISTSKAPELFIKNNFEKGKTIKAA